MTLAVDDRVELRELRAIERKLLQLLRRHTEILAQAGIVVDELRVLQNQVLAHEAFERCGLFIGLPAGAAGLRGLQHRLLTLRTEPV